MYADARNRRIKDIPNAVRVMCAMEEPVCAAAHPTASVRIDAAKGDMTAPAKESVVENWV